MPITPNATSAQPENTANSCLLLVCKVLDLLGRTICSVVSSLLLNRKR